MFFNGTWGTVCNDLFDENDANVSCYELGFSEALHYHHVGMLEYDPLLSVNISNHLSTQVSAWPKPTADIPG